MPRANDTPEESRIRQIIIQKTLKGLSPRMVLRYPKIDVEALVLTGLTNHELGKRLGVSDATANQLRQYYGLPKSEEVRKMLECVEPDEPVTPEQAGRAMTAMAEAFKKAEIKREPGIIDQAVTVLEKAAEKFADKVAKSFIDGEPEPGKEPVGILGQDEPFYSFHRTDRARILYGIVAGVARMLKEMGEEQVSVTVEVRKL